MCMCVLIQSQSNMTNFSLDSWPCTCAGHCRYLPKWGIHTHILLFVSIKWKTQQEGAKWEWCVRVSPAELDTAGLVHSPSTLCQQQNREKLLNVKQHVGKVLHMMIHPVLSSPTSYKLHIYIYWKSDHISMNITASNKHTTVMQMVTVTSTTGFYRVR